MKYNEMEKIAVEAGYEIVDDPVSYCMKHKYRNNYISVSKTLVRFIFIENEHCRPEDFKVIKAAVELSETSISERQEEKEYYLKHRFLEHSNYSYLNYDQKLQKLYLNDKVQIDYVQTQFTQAEIDEIKEKYDTDLKDFEQIEVEEWQWI